MIKQKEDNLLKTQKNEYFSESIISKSLMLDLKNAEKEMEKPGARWLTLDNIFSSFKKLDALNKINV
jgi:hypothetical protein